MRQTHCLKPPYLPCEQLGSSLAFDRCCTYTPRCFFFGGLPTYTYKIRHRKLACCISCLLSRVLGACEVAWYLDSDCKSLKAEITYD